MFLYFILLAFLNFVNSSEICKSLHVSTNLKKSKDDIVSKGIPAKQWNRKAKNPIIVPATQNIDYIYITSDNPNLTLENFQLDFDDHYFADSSIRLDHRPNGQHTEYAIEVNYKCKQYGGTLINYNKETYHFLFDYINTLTNIHLRFKKLISIKNEKKSRRDH